MKSVVFGSSRGIGASLSNRLSAAGHEVIGVSRNRGEASMSEHHTLDVVSEDWSALPDFDTLDHLVFCPGSITLKPFRGLKSEHFRSDYEINVLAAVRAIQHCLGALKKGTDPSILLFSTVAVQTGMPFHASIAAAKGAVEALTRSLAAELAPKIRVNCLAPSLTDTPLAEALLNNERKQAGANERHPLKRYGQPEDLASAAEFMLNASWITGQVLGVDGGMSTLKP